MRDMDMTSFVTDLRHLFLSSVVFQKWLLASGVEFWQAFRLYEFVLQDGYWREKD